MSVKQTMERMVIRSGWVAFAVFAVATANAQENMRAIIAKYKNENAVITSYSEHLIIKNENGKLVASTTVSEQRMLMSDLAAGMYNKAFIFHSYFNKLEEYDAKASIPTRNGYRTMRDYDVKTNPSERGNIFYDDGKQTEITFTGLTKYSLLEDTYTIGHTDLNMLQSFYFQENLPVAQATFEVTAPKYVNLNFVLKGEHTDWIKQTKDESRNTITYRFTASDIPALKVYDDVPSISYYTPHVIPYITSYQLPHDDKPTELLKDPAHLYTYYYNYIKNINTKEDETLNKTVAEITREDKTQLEKAAHIYQWVQKNMHYIAFEDSLGGFIPRQAADICKRKFGDCKDMASILTAMCRQAGIDAHFTWIGTRHLPYTYEETPLPLVDNHMICAIKPGDDWIFMDGTDPEIPFGENPETIQGKEALIAIDEKNFKIIKVPETPADVNRTSDSTVLHIDGTNVAGTVTLNYQGYPAWGLGTMMMYYKNDDRKKTILEIASRGSNKYVQNSYKYTQADNGDKDACIKSEFTIDDYAQHAGKEYFVNLNLERDYENNHVDIKERQVPLSFKYKDKVKQVVVLGIPKGFHASYIPKDVSGSLDGAWSYKISYTTTPEAVILTKEYELKTLSIGANQFDDNNKMVDDLRKQYKESIVLTEN